jgi:hypothetical protein
LVTYCSPASARPARAFRDDNQPGGVLPSAANPLLRKTSRPLTVRAAATCRSAVEAATSWTETTSAGLPSITDPARSAGCLGS